MPALVGRPCSGQTQTPALNNLLVHQYIYVLTYTHAVVSLNSRPAPHPRFLYFRLIPAPAPTPKPKNGPQSPDCNPLP